MYSTLDYPGRVRLAARIRARIMTARKWRHIGTMARLRAQLDAVLQEK